MANTVICEWVKKEFRGDAAKHVLGLAGRDVGYYVLDRPDDGKDWVVAAYRRAVHVDGDLPQGITRITNDTMITRLETWMKPMTSRV